MASVRLFVLAAGLSAGILASEALRPGPPVAVALGASAVLLTAVGARLARSRLASAVVAASVAAVALGMGLAGLRLASLDRGALARGAGRGADALLEGRIAAVPETANGVLRFPLNVRRAEIDGRPLAVRERVLVSVRPPPAPGLGPGDRVRVDARLAPGMPAGVNAASARAAAARLRWAGIDARAYARPQGVERLGGPRGPLDVVGRAGRRAVARPVLRLPPREAGLLLGVVIGDTSRLDPRIEADFKTTGLTHLLAVSGENLVLFLGAVAFGLRALRAGRRTSLAVLSAALIAFMAITRFEPSVLRAGLMGAVGLAGIALGARRETLSALAIAAIVLLVADPFILHAIGFQLSALATLGILILGPRLRAALPGKLGTAAAITLAAQLAVAPLIALTFHTVSVISLPANLIAVPAVGPATVLGVVAAPLGAVWSGFGIACVTVARPFLWWMLGAAGIFARVPHASVGTPSGWPGALAVLLLLAAVAGAAKMRRAPRAATGMLAALLLVAGNVWAGALAPPLPVGLEVVALDVGQGDAILVRDPGGATMLVDGGPDPAILERRLAAHGVRRIDLLVLTHPHADHVDGIIDVLARMPVGRALDAGIADDLPGYAPYERALRAAHVPRDRAHAGMRYALGAAVIEVLAPDGAPFVGTDSDPNNNSVILRVRYGAGAVLLPGDAQQEVQQRLLEDDPQGLAAAVFKVPHHGSAKFLRDFYAATHAVAAVISVGQNDFGQPSERSLAALAALGMRAYRTDRSGDVTAVLGGDGSLLVREQRTSSGELRVPASGEPRAPASPAAAAA